MMTKNADKKREQMMMFSMDDMVPQNHILRLIDKAINWNFIYDLVEEKYCPDNGRPSMDEGGGRAHCAFWQHGAAGWHRDRGRSHGQPGGLDR